MIMFKEDDEGPLYFILQQIKDGQRDPKTLTPKMRIELEKLLLAENYGKAQLAIFFQVSDKTIQRDMRQIYEEACKELEHDGRVFVGKFAARVEFCWYQLMRILKDPVSSQCERIRALAQCGKINRDSLEKAQKLGFLPLMSGVRNSKVWEFSKGKEKKKPAPKLSLRDQELIKLFKLLPPLDREKIIQLLENAMMAQTIEEIEQSDKELDDFLNKKLKERFGDDAEDVPEG